MSISIYSKTITKHKDMYDRISNGLIRKNITIISKE